MRNRTFLVGLVALSIALLGCTEESEYIPPEDDVGEAPAPPPQQDPPPQEEPPPPEEPAEDPPSDDGDLLACSFDEIGDLLTCAIEECLIGGFDPSDPSSFDPSMGGFDIGELLVCAGVSCLPVILGLSPDCADCILEGVSGGGTDELLEACAGDLGDLGGLLGGLGGGGGGLPF